MTITQPRTRPNRNTRERRALELYRTRGHEIRKASPGEDLYLVPSCTGRGFYSVDYREETCDCADFTHRRENCKHILAVGVLVAKRRSRLRQVCACNDGWITLGQIVIDPETGEETEESALYLCRRCADSR